MSKVAIKLYGREYLVNCDPGEEDRLKDVVKLVESRIQKAAERTGPVTVTDNHVLALAALSLADELHELCQNASKSRAREEDIMVAAVDHLRQRVAHIAGQVGRA
jgi:cell division protein ZapA